VISFTGNPLTSAAAALATGTVSSMTRGIIEPRYNLGGAISAMQASEQMLAEKMRAVCDLGRQSMHVGLQETVFAPWEKQEQRLAELCKGSAWESQLQRHTEQMERTQRLVDSYKSPAFVLDMFKPAAFEMPKPPAVFSRLGLSHSPFGAPAYKPSFDFSNLGVSSALTMPTCGLGTSALGAIEKRLAVFAAAENTASQAAAKLWERNRDAVKRMLRNLRVLAEEIARAPMAARQFLSRRVAVALGSSRRRARRWIARALAVLASWNPLFTHRDRRTVTERPGRCEYLKNFLGEIELAPPGSLDPVAGAVSRRGPPPTYTASSFYTPGSGLAYGMELELT
jgi:hypothetical protein